MRPVLDDGFPEGVEEGEEEGRGEGEEEGCEGFREALLGDGAVGVEDAYAVSLVPLLDGAGDRRWDGIQKKRPFQILRSSMVVKARPEQR